MDQIEELYKNYFRAVFLFAKNLSKSDQIAQDITSETFLKAMKSLDSFRGGCDIRVWLCQIAKNCYFSYLRKNKVSEADACFAESADDFCVEQAVADSQLSERIHQILHQMEEPYKEVFTLRIFGELSFRQIANLFGKTENWACVTYHRARKKIREGLGDFL